MVFFRKFHVRGNGILADADHDNVFFPEGVIGRSEGAGLFCAAGGIVPGIEVQNHFLSKKSRQAHFLSVLIHQGKIGGFLSGLQHIFLPPCWGAVYFHYIVYTALRH